jgi:hypothetical protein
MMLKFPPFHGPGGIHGFLFGICSEDLRIEPVESSYEFDVPLIIERESGQKAAPRVAEEIQELDNLSEGIDLLRGLFFGILFSIPIWALILWGVL